MSRLFRFFGTLGKPREVHPKFRNFISKNVFSTRFLIQSFRKFWSKGKRPINEFELFCIFPVVFLVFLQRLIIKNSVILIFLLVQLRLGKKNTQACSCKLASLKLSVLLTRLNFVGMTAYAGKTEESNIKINICYVVKLKLQFDL